MKLISNKNLIFMVLLPLVGCHYSSAPHAPETSKAQALRQPDYSYACWLNGWRKNKSDTTQALFAIETSQYAFSLNPSDFSKAGFTFDNKPGNGYAEALHSGTARLHQLPSAELVLELETDGRIYRAVNCKAGTGTDARRLSPARMWESGRLVQHYDFLGLNFLVATGKALSCTGTLDLVAWPDSLTLTASLAPVGSTWTNTTLRIALTGHGTGVSPVGKEAHGRDARDDVITTNSVLCLPITLCAVYFLFFYMAQI